MRRWKVVLFYLVLALLCYGIASTAGGGPALAVFLAAAIFWELMFWKEILGLDRKELAPPPGGKASSESNEG